MYLPFTYPACSPLTVFICLKMDTKKKICIDQDRGLKITIMSAHLEIVSTSQEATMFIRHWKQ